jgi:tetratricopeptide (TPR) repeat protein
LLCFLPGCFRSGWSSETTPPPRQVIVTDLPDDVPELIALSDAKIQASASVQELAVAVQALEKAEQLMAERETEVLPVDVHIRMIKACFLITEQEQDTDQRMAWIKHGIEVGELIKKESPKRVEGYYYQAVLKGRHAEQGGLSAFVETREVEELGQKAVKIDPAYEYGAPLRLMAMLYAKAPPWPTSVGDVDLSLEYAERALVVSDYPLNHLIMAEVLIAAEEFDDAREELKKVLSAPNEGKWAKESGQWQPRAQRLLKQLDNNK